MLLPSLQIHEQPLETAASAVFPWSEALARKYSLTSRFGEPYQLWRKSGDYMLVPRECAPVSERDNRALGLPIDVEFKGAPRDEEQARVFAELESFLLRGESGILQASTGAGKTVCGAKAVAVVKRKTLVLIPKEDLISQWHESFMRFLGLKQHEIGHLQADKINVAGKKVVIGTIHSLALDDRYDPEMLAQFGMVIVDETHRAASDELQKCFSNLPAMIRLGLSATPKRSDGKEQVLYANLGPIRVVSDILPMIPKVMQVMTGWTVPRRIVKSKSGVVSTMPIPHSPGKIMHIINFMARNEARNNLIGRFASMAYAKERRTVIFVDTLDHVEAAIAACVKRGVPLLDIARYVGGMKESAREVAKTKRLVVGTFKMFSEGTNVPQLDTAILGTPKADIVQTAGRILRSFPGKKQPLIIDLVDEGPVFKAYATKRCRWYVSIGAEVTLID